MKTINMDIMQNIFLMKHFTQCTFVFTTCVNILYIFSNKCLHAETLKMGCGVMKINKKKKLLVWNFVSKN